MERLSRLSDLLSKLRGGVEDHLMSQLEEERPDDVERRKKDVQKLAGRVANAAAQEIVAASLELEGMYEHALRRYIRSLLEDVDSDIEATIGGLDEEDGDHVDRQDTRRRARVGT